MKYKLYYTNSINDLEDEVLIDLAENYQDACKKIRIWLERTKQPSEPYWRFLLAENATFVDFGSWSKFIAIVPPISPQEMIGEE